jgi:hypothetical protein
MPQVVVRFDSPTHAAFKQAAEQRYGSMQHAVEVFAEALVKHEATATIYHMDGTPCPVSAMLASIAACVEMEVAAKFHLTTHAPPKPPATTRDEARESLADSA